MYSRDARPLTCTGSWRSSTGCTPPVVSGCEVRSVASARMGNEKILRRRKREASLMVAAVDRRPEPGQTHGASRIARSPVTVISTGRLAARTKVGPLLERTDKAWHTKGAQLAVNATAGESCVMGSNDSGSGLVHTEPSSYRTVSEDALRKRINRALRREESVLRKSRTRAAELDLGVYYVVDCYTGFVIDSFLDLEELGRELGVLRHWERLE